MACGFAARVVFAAVPRRVVGTAPRAAAAAPRGAAATAPDDVATFAPAGAVRPRTGADATAGARDLAGLVASTSRRTHPVHRTLTHSPRFVTLVSVVPLRRSASTEAVDEGAARSRAPDRAVATERVPVPSAELLT